MVLGRGIPLGPKSPQDKMVTGGRGGYCHEQNLPFAAALERLGFPVTRLLARIRLGGRSLGRSRPAGVPPAR
ncbi:arylamine N-acetyltransferase [Nonomuraea sp. CA-218870]|uniref:arylamine N-acetyltransferase n=1 Tax=Nonomuraea sp. CA-218870 TaxID=3239998 RepID=UPI003D8B7CD0